MEYLCIPLKHQCFQNMPREKIWFVQGDNTNEWLPASQLHEWMCNMAWSGRSNLQGFENPIWAAESKEGIFVCTRDGGSGIHDPLGNLYIWNIKTGTKRFVQYLDMHKGAQMLTGGTDLMHMIGSIKYAIGKGKLEGNTYTLPRLTSGNCFSCDRQFSPSSHAARRRLDKK